MTISGKVADIKEETQVTEKFRKRELWLEVPDGKYPQTLSIEFLNNQCALLEEISIGEDVTIEFNLRGRQHKDRVYNTIVGWKITVNPKADESRMVKQQHIAKQPVNQKTFENAADDLPF